MLNQKPSNQNASPVLPAVIPSTEAIEAPSRMPFKGFDQLAAPSRHQANTETRKEPTRAIQPEPEAPLRLLGVGTIAETAVGSAAVWSGVGASVVCLDSSILGVLGHGLSTLWTFRNELREKAGALQSKGASTERVGKPGYLGIALDALYSPGFNKVAMGVTYLTAGLEAGVRGHPLECAVFSSYFVGCMTVVAVLNQSYSGTRTTTTLPERAFKKMWGMLPARLQTLLKDPGLYMTLGNSSLVVGTMNLKSLLSEPMATTVLGLGLAISSLGLVSTARNLFSGTESTKGQAGSVYLNGAANGLFGVASFLQGSPVVGAAKMCWAVACGLLARMMMSGPKKQ